MEVKGISQGRQTTFESDRSINKDVQNKGTQNDNKDVGTKEISTKELKNSVDKLNKFLEDNKTHAEYEYHDKLKNNLMIKIIDDETGEVIQEVPLKKILDMVAKMMEMVGVLFDKKA